MANSPFRSLEKGPDEMGSQDTRAAVQAGRGPEGGPGPLGPHTSAAIASGNATTGTITFPLTAALG